MSEYVFQAPKIETQPIKIFSIEIEKIKLSAKYFQTLKLLRVFKFT